MPIKVGAAKVEAERWTDDRHCDGEEVVVVDENWNAVPTNVRHFEILQPFEYRNFPVCRRFRDHGF